MAKVANNYFLVDPWKVIEEGFDPAHARVAEAIFSVANEFMGVRGYFEEGYSGDMLLGSYINAVFATHIEVQWKHKGMNSRDCFVVNSVDWLYTRITLDGERLDLAKSAFSGFRRVLDMKTGVMSREFVWELANGKLLKLSFERFTSMDISNVGCQRITFTPLNFCGNIEIQSCLDFSTFREHSGNINYWTCLNKDRVDDMFVIQSLTEDSGQQVLSSFRLNLPMPVDVTPVESEKLIGAEFTLPLTLGTPVSIDKIVVNYAERKCGVNPEDVWNDGLLLARNYSELSYDELMDAHINHWATAWETLDIVIEGDPMNQQGFRFCVFNLHQTYHGNDNTLNIGGKGLTGESYGGKTWWDTETYILPFYLFSNPDAARNLVEYRYHHLPQALERAKEMDCFGACYPMSTLDGSECGNWWTHGNIEIHVSAAIPYGIWHYVNVTNDEDYLYDQGLEILIQSSRYFASRGQWGQETGKYGFFGVMGADEFHMMVNNNYYTNLMAKKVFEYTLQVIAEMEEHVPEKLKEVVEKVNLGDKEPDDWRLKASLMKLPVDDETGIFEQHDGFFDLPHTNYKELDPSNFPLYQNWSYDSIFRTDMIKQPDSILPLLFFSQEYSQETKRVNYEYYEPKCCHDSSLSPCIHSVLAAELGMHDKALEYAKFASRIDLDDYNRNTCEGLHTPALAGAWLNLVYGFGGLRSDGEKLVFNPSIPKGWEMFSFNLMYRGTRIHAKINRGTVSFDTNGGSIPIIVYGKEYVIDESGVEIKMPADRYALSKEVD